MQKGISENYVRYIEAKKAASGSEDVPAEADDVGDDIHFEISESDETEEVDVDDDDDW